MRKPRSISLPLPRLTRAILATVLFSLSITAAATAPAAPPGWQVEFVDDFDGSADQQPARTAWQYNLGNSWPGGPPGWGNNEAQHYTDLHENSSLSGDGELHITPLRDLAGRWTSARLQTHRANFKAPPGGIMRAEARMRLPDVSGDAALGYWPAFWMLASANAPGWPAGGEFDIMENVNGLDRHWGVLHCGVAPGGPCNENNGIAAHQPCPEIACQSEFHVYAFEWDRSVQPEQLRWYIDGQLYHQVNEDMLPATTWWNMTSHEGFTVLLNLAIGGSFPNGVAGHLTPVAATSPGHAFRIDYVGVWTRDHGTAPMARSFAPTTAQ